MDTTGKIKNRSRVGLVAAMSLVACGISSSAGWAAEPELPGTMVWTAYDIGGAGYAEASGLANAFMKAHDVRVRIVPSGTSIGRLLPMSTGKASYGFLATEVYFATEAAYDFAAIDWGPQDLRVVLGRPAGFGIATAADTGVETIADLKGKRIGFVKGNPSVNVKTDATLAFGGLTRDDVEPVWFGSYAVMKTAVIANQLDGFGSVSASAHMREIQASPRGLTWPTMPADDMESWGRVQKIVDFLAPLADPDAVGCSPEDLCPIASYRFPLLTTYARMSEEEVYAVTKTADETFPLYKETTAGAKGWAIERAGKTPADAPWHPGAIRYLKEQGVWTAEDQAWQEARLARLEQVMTAWDEAVDSFQQWRADEGEKGNQVAIDEAWPEYWKKFRAEHVDGSS